MMVSYEIDSSTKLTLSQKARLLKAKFSPISADADNPILTKEQLKKLRRVNSSNTVK